MMRATNWPRLTGETSVASAKHRRNMDRRPDGMPKGIQTVRRGVNLREIKLSREAARAMAEFLQTDNGRKFRRAVGR